MNWVHLAIHWIHTNTYFLCWLSNRKLFIFSFFFFFVVVEIANWQSYNKALENKNLITSLTWKYVPLRGKLPLIAVLQGIYKEIAVSAKTTKKRKKKGKKGTKLSIILLLLVIIISLSFSPELCLWPFEPLLLLCCCMKSMFSCCTDHLLPESYIYFLEVELNLPSHLVKKISVWVYSAE